MKNKIINTPELIVYDFDGVMTDNRVMIDQAGNEYVWVNRSDGLAVSKFKDMGIRQIIISTETNPVVEKRALKLGIMCISGVVNKKKALDRYLKKTRIDRSKVAFLGNDINDLEVMKSVGISVAPSDAHEEVKKAAMIITKKYGGAGVVREFMDIVIGKRG
jgi:YrbI family 3-deoxy-D-manno-octulosonate 8-phosphate phosphatase